MLTTFVKKTIIYDTVIYFGQKNRKIKVSQSCTIHMLSLAWYVFFKFSVNNGGLVVDRQIVMLQLADYGAKIKAHLTLFASCSSATQWPWTARFSPPLHQFYRGNAYTGYADNAYMGLYCHLVRSQSICLSWHYHQNKQTSLNQSLRIGDNSSQWRRV